MVQSKAASVSDYLKQLPPERRAVLKQVRQCIRANIQRGFVETMSWGMISYEIPLSRFPETYNKKPLLYCALAAQKNHYAVYLMCVYAGSRHLAVLEIGYWTAGINLDIGKCCLRFRKPDQIHLPTLGKVVAACSVEDYIEIYQAAHG